MCPDKIDITLLDKQFQMINAYVQFINIIPVYIAAYSIKNYQATEYVVY